MSCKHIGVRCCILCGMKFVPADGELFLDGEVMRAREVIDGDGRARVHYEQYPARPDLIGFSAGKGSRPK